MVRFLHCFFIACLGGFFICNGNDEELFLGANKYGTQQEWEQALVTYKRMKQKGNIVWFNMGNCCYHLKQYAQALIYWKRAQKDASRLIYTQSKHNEKHLMQQLNKELPTHWMQQFYDFFVYSVTGISLLLLQLLFLLCWFLFFFLQWYRAKRFFFVSLILLLFNGLIGVGMIVKQKETDKIGIIVTDNADVFAGPSNEYHVLNKLKHIDQVTIHDVKPDWYKVKYAAGTGWIPATAVQVV